MKFNGKEIGKDRFEIEDVKALDEKQLLEYQIAVMQWYKEGGGIEIFTDNRSQGIELPRWDWSYFIYFPVPKPSYPERQAQWVKENNVKVGDKVKCLPFKSCQDGCMVVVGAACRFFGQEAEILSINKDSIILTKGDSTLSFPYFALELIKPSYKPYEKADPSWLVKTDEVVKVKNEDCFTQIREVYCKDKQMAIRLTNGGWFSLEYMFTNYEWYNIATGETRPFGERI